MIKTPKENSTVLSVAQQNQVNLLERKVVNLQEDITTNKKLQKELQAECDKLNKEKEYLTEVNEELSSKIKKEKVTLKNLLAEIKDSSDTLESNLKKASEDQKVLSQRLKDIEERENKVSSLEVELNKKVEDFNIKSSQLLKDQLSIKTAKDAFLKATETVVW